jgi:hypothetical protein
MRKTIELRNLKFKTKKKGDVVKLDFKKVAEFKEKFTKVRGEIIEHSMAIISELNHFFRIMDIENPKSEYGEDYMDIWKLFRETIHELLPEYKDSTKKLRRDLHEAIETRDKYAHGDLGFTNNNPHITIKKGKSGETITEPIDDKILQRDINLVENVKNELRNLNLLLRTK